MTEPKDPLSRAETGGWETKFSRLEAELVKTEVEQRPNSRSQNGVNRHAETSDLSVNELNFDFNRDESHYPLHDLRSLQQVFDAVQCQQHLEKVENFSLGTQVECLDVGVNGGGKHPVFPE